MKPAGQSTRADGVAGQRRAVEGRTGANGHLARSRVKRLPAQRPAARGPTPLVVPEGKPRFVGRLLRQSWKSYRKALKRCQRKFSPGAIHDFRVESRRLMASLQLLCELEPARRIEKLQRLLKRRLDLFDGLRDTHVQRKAIADMREEFPAARLFSKSLCKQERRFARRACKQIRKTSTRRVAREIDGCREDLDERLEKLTATQVSAALLRTVDRAFRRTRQRRARIARHDTKTIHKTRVAFKQFRYMVERLAEWMPSATKPRLEAMHRYQAMMGAIQDTVVLLAALDEFLREQDVPPPSARSFRQQLVHRRRQLVRTYLHAADQLSTFWPVRGAGVPPAAWPKTN